MEVQVPVEKLFGSVQADWEKSVPFPAAEPLDWTPLSRTPLQQGYRVRCAGRPLGLPGTVELQVIEFEANRGWAAASTSRPRLVWRVKTTPRRDGGSRLAYRLEVRAKGLRYLADRLFGASRRAATLEALLERLKARAEREQALQRLRTRSTVRGE
jgi:hypothetical protein